jgi:hypothetical protein
MNLVIIGRFPADTEARIRAFFPPVWRVVFAGPDLAGPGLRDAEALIPDQCRPVGQGPEDADDPDRGRV